MPGCMEDNEFRSLGALRLKTSSCSKWCEKKTGQTEGVKKAKTEEKQRNEARNSKENKEDGQERKYSDSTVLSSALSNIYIVKRMLAPHIGLWLLESS